MSSGLAIKRTILSRDAARFVFSRYRLHSTHRMFRANSRIDEAIAAGSAGLRRRDSILREIRSFRLRGSRFCAVASSKTAVPKVWPAIPRLAPLSMAPTTALKNAARPMIRQAAVSAYLSEGGLFLTGTRAGILPVPHGTSRLEPFAPKFGSRLSIVDLKTSRGARLQCRTES
jgi:hypothetical protein